MSESLNTVVKQLEDSGIVSAGDVKSFLSQPQSPQTPEQLTQVLVEQKRLTVFQAERVNTRQTASLVLGSYTLIDKIGAGGMGQVFKAEHRRMKRVVALKMLPASLASDPSAVARFEREVEAAAKLNHPNIVTAYDADQADGVHFLVMEYVEGCDLAALVKAKGPCSVAQAIDYVLQAARGLAFAHKKGVVHRDIKPANLLLDNEGTVKILDMGLARLDGALGAEAAPQAELTGTGAIMGTVDYMSPEQAYNTKNADARADIYSLGCTLHYLLSGTATYSGDTLMEKLLAHRERPVPSLKNIRPDLPNRIDEVFRKMVAKRVEDRHQKMSEVIAELTQCAAELTIATHETLTENPGTVILASTIRSTAPVAVPPAPKVAALTSAAGGSGNRRKWLIFGAAAGGFLALLLGVIIVIRDDKGKEIGRIELPPGQTAEVLSGVSKPTAVPKSTATPKPMATPNATTGLQSTRKPITDINSPAFQAWLKEVAAKPASDQLEAVSKKMMELNPGFDGKIHGYNGAPVPKIDGGVVTEIGFSGAEVTDLSPVRALSGLTALSCFARGPAIGKLSDLSPLAGLRLKMFSCMLTHVADLTPLRGMPLQLLHCNNTDVVDVSTLEGMDLNDVGLPLANVSRGLDVVRSMPNLRLVRRDMLAVNNLPAAEFRRKFDAGEFGRRPTDINSPAFQAWMKEVAAMPAAEQIDAVSKKMMELNPGFDGKVWLSSGNGSPKIVNNEVTAIGIFADDVTDLSPVRALEKLDTLYCPGRIPRKSKLFDLSSLKGLNLKIFNCPHTEVADLSPLQGMELQSIGCASTQVSDLSPLKGMPLNFIDCAQTNVSSLSPLEGMSLKILQLGQTAVSDLTPLRGMALTQLGCHSTQVADLSPLHSCQDLTSLIVQSTKVTPAGVAELQKALPNCKIEWDDPAKGSPQPGASGTK